MVDAYDIIEEICDINGLCWYVDITAPEPKLWIYDPDDCAKIILDKLYIGMIHGKDNIKFLQEHLNTK